MASTAAAGSTSKFAPRVRFNWGFWDGHADGRERRTAIWGRNGQPHFDGAYEDGYWAGRAAAAAGEVPETSDAAWGVR